MENLGKECLQTKSKIRGFGISLKKRPAKPPKTESSPILATTKTDVADDAIEVEDYSTEPGSSKESCNKTDREKETLAQSNLQTELEEINDELASYACIGERTGLSHEYKERVRERERERELKLQPVEKKLNRKIQDFQSQQRLREKKKKALEKLTQYPSDVSNVPIYHKFSSCHGLSALFV